MTSKLPKLMPPTQSSYDPVVTSSTSTRKSRWHCASRRKRAFAFPLPVSATRLTSVVSTAEQLAGGGGGGGGGGSGSGCPASSGKEAYENRSVPEHGVAVASRTSRRESSGSGRSSP